MNANAIHTINVTRDPTILRPDQSRVLLRPFSPGDSERVSGKHYRADSGDSGRTGPGGAGREVSRGVLGAASRNIREIFLARYEQMLREMLASRRGMFPEDSAVNG